MSVTIPSIATAGQRAAALQHAAQCAAGAHVQQLVDAMQVVEDLAREVAGGGDVYPAGIRDLARRHAEATRHGITHIYAVGAR